MNPLRKAENYKVTRVLTNQPTEIIQWDLSSDGRKIENVAELLVIYIHFTFLTVTFLAQFEQQN